MKKQLIFLAFASAVYADAPAMTTPAPNAAIQYKAMRTNGTTIHLIITKPNGLEVIVASGRKRLSSMVSLYEMSEKKNVLAAVNGGYFDLESGTPVGTLIHHGKRLMVEDRHRAQMAIAVQGVLFGYYGTADQFTDLVTGGPYLVKNQQNIAVAASAVESFDAYYLRPHPRTAIGKRSDGTVVLLVADGRRPNERGLRLDELASHLLAQQCIEAINFDGGGSSTMLLSGEFYGKPKDNNYIQNRPSDGHERAIANGIIVVERK